jgi:hypothetical protein
MTADMDAPCHKDLQNGGVDSSHPPLRLHSPGNNPASTNVRFRPRRSSLLYDAVERDGGFELVQVPLAVAYRWGWAT